MADGLDKITSLLINEGIFDDKGLPTNAVLWVGAALYSHISKPGDGRGWCEILKRYVWRSSLTDRYESSVATQAHDDYSSLRKVLLSRLGRVGGEFLEGQMRIFYKSAHPLPSTNDIKDVGWLTRASILGGWSIGHCRVFPILQLEKGSTNTISHPKLPPYLSRFVIARGAGIQ